MIAWTAHMDRRTFIRTTGVLAAGAAFAPHILRAQAAAPIRRPIPSTGELLPVMGMGTSQTFDVGAGAAERAPLAEVLQVFFERGGALIDSSPMYGRAETVVGELLAARGTRPPVFAATKVWTDGRERGIAQMEESSRRLGVEVVDLMQIHNLRDWRTHLPVLREWKEEGRIRYLGITTSHGRDHEALEAILRAESLDFVQFSYNLEDRAVEERLLPLAAERGVATLVNRPFQRGGLFRKAQGVALPEWSAECDARTWGQFFLKFILGHPAVTCVIPATAKARHMEDNMGAGFGRLPDAGLRRRMVDFYAAL